MLNSIKAMCLGVVLLLAGCLEGGPGLSNVRPGGGENEVVSGSAGEAGSKGTAALRRCAKPIGTAALSEDSSNQAILVQYGLPSSPMPLMRLLMQQSNCFRVVDRGAGLRAVQQEQALAKQGMLQGGKSHRAQLVSAKYTITPNVVFSENNAGGAGAGLATLGSFLGPLGMIAGAVAGSMKFKQAQVLLFATDNRTGVQVASATGTGKATDVGIGAGVLGTTSVGAGAWGNTNEGKVVAAAFVDAINQLVDQMQHR
ncbi:MAG TPA: curli production assembly/transport component CsgG [Acidiferrobacteraceae bacterium]|nr:curli production assembly/transport component CsgG [Acidiferrobacteraceae bacterium]